MRASDGGKRRRTLRNKNRRKRAQKSVALLVSMTDEEYREYMDRWHVGQSEVM